MSERGENSAARTPASSRRPRRRWWQHVLRASAAVLLIAASGYATLPYWLPADALARWVTDDLSRQTGLHVTCDAASVSWARGIELEGLTIHPPKGFAPEPVVRVERLAVDFSPLRVLAGVPLAWTEIHRPHLFVHLREDGRLNVEPLGDLQFDIRSERTLVHDARVTIRLQDPNRLLHFDVASLHYREGRLRDAGKLTLSAALDQPPHPPAPVGLHLRNEPEGPVAAAGTFNFSEVDLAQLPLIELLDLPLRKLAGRAGGSLHVRVSEEGHVEHCQLDLRMRHFLVQPKQGPETPVIDPAGLKLSAAMDPIAGTVSIDSASLRLPGADLSLEAELTSGVVETWRALRHVRFEGQVIPRRFLALLGRAEDLPGGLSVLGPVRLSGRIERSGPRVTGALTLDADAMELRRGGTLIKQRGRPLHLEARGTLRERQRRIDLDSLRLSAGSGETANTFSLRHGRVDLEKLDSLAGRMPLPAALAAASGAEAEWTLRDEAPVLRATGLAGLRDRLKIDGPLTGRLTWRGDRAELDLSLEAPPTTRIRFGEQVLATGLPLRASVTGRVEPGTFRDVDVELARGRARLDVTAARLRWGPERLDAAGDYTLRDPSDLLAAAPELAKRLTLTGPIRGSAKLQATGAKQRGELSARLDRAGLHAGVFLRKPPGQPAKVDLNWRTSERARLAGVTLTVPAGRLGLAQWDAPTPGGELRFELDDAAALVELSPALKDLLGGIRPGGELSGSVKLLRPTDKPMTLSVAAAGDEFRLHLGGEKHPRIRPGTPVEVRAELLVGLDAGRADLRLVRPARLRLGRSTLSVGGRATLPDAPQSLDLARLPAFLADAGKPRNAAVSLEATVHADDALRRAVPALREALNDARVAGHVRCRGEAYLTPRAMRIGAELDATALAGRLRMSRVPGERIVKKRGAVLTARCELSGGTPPGPVSLRELNVTFGPVTVRGVGSAHLAWAKDRPRITAERLGGRLDVRSLAELVELAPGLERYRPRGRVSLTAAGLSPTAGRVEAIELTLDDAAGRYRDREVRLDGKVLAGRVRDLLPRRVHTEGLKFAVEGVASGYVVADVTADPTRPRGTVRVLGSFLDDAELVAWLGGKPPAPAGAPLKPADRQALRNRASDLVRRCAAPARRAELDARISLKRVRSLDLVTGETYLIRRAELRAAAREGKLALAFTGGLNGGLLDYEVRADLRTRTPTVSARQRMTEAIAEKNLQPQIALFFPGNTVEGTFTREERVTLPLVDWVGLGLDPRFAARKQGWARTVATGGVVVGRSAPKFITRIFPGLNLTRYEYDRMTAFAEIHPDGSMTNDMIFSGASYDMYIEGTTDPDHHARYTVGLVLLGTTLSPDWHHTWRQGRLPILKIRGLIEDGVMKNQEVSYPWPNESLGEVLLTNNIVYRLWVNSGKKH